MAAGITECSDTTQQDVRRPAPSCHPTTGREAAIAHTLSARHVRETLEDAFELLKHRTAHSRRSSVPCSYERISKASWFLDELNNIH